ncbi:MAG: cation:proton antiporter [Polyangiaceae bacterium]|nr:cation:proton antiporter [Polyangiaceae bacterium]
MGHVPYLDELAMIAVLGVLVTVLLSKLKLPTVAGLLAAGALVGPFGLHLAKSVHAIEVLAEVGVVLLLFTIGLELSLARLKNIFQRVALGGFIQVGLTTAVTAAVAVWFGQPLKRGIFYGFVFALSSTAIVLRALEERREIDAPHGRFIVGTLIFQDLCVVPMVVVVPFLGGTTHEGGIITTIVLATLKALAIVIAMVGGSRILVPKLLGWVDASRSREVFLLAIVGLCIGTAWLTSLAGLSLALGAFLAGMVVADTQYRHRATGDILPLRDILMSIFFVSLGMLFDVRVVLTEPVLVLVLLLGFLVAKGMLATVAALVMRFPARAAWLSGVGLAQLGEFGFVLTRLAREHGVVDEVSTRPLLAAGILSMFLTPLLVRAAPHVTAGEKILAPLSKLIGVRTTDELEVSQRLLHDHVVIVGFGLAGRFAAQALSESNIPFVVLELNAENVRKGKEEGLPVYYADATSAEALHHVHIEKARLVVLLMNDPQAAERITDTLKRVARNVPVLFRTRYFSDRDRLVELGAHDVVAEEVEGGVEILSRMLRFMDVPRNVIEQRIHEVRGKTQTTCRKLTVPRARLGQLRALDEMKIESVIVREGSRAANVSPVALKLRTETGALVVGVVRENKLLEKADPTQIFELGDVVYLVGTGEALSRALVYFDVPSE